MRIHFFTALLFLNLLTLRSLLCHLSLIHRGQCILQNLRKVYMIGFCECIQPGRNRQIFRTALFP